MKLLASMMEVRPAMNASSRVVMMFSISELSLASLQAQRVDQDALIGNGHRNALEFGQPAAAAGPPLEDGGGVEAGGAHPFSSDPLKAALAPP